MKSPDGAPIGNTPNPSNGQVAVRIRNVSKTFPGQKALDDVGFDIQSGSIHALLGHNGSGKSTLIKILAGIYTPDAGALIEVGGHRLHSGSPRDSAKSGLRFVHQDLGLVDELTAAENMALTWGYPRRGGLGINWAVHSRNVVTALNRLNMSLDIDRPIGELRAVERTAVAIARALGEPNRAIGVLVLDEPTAALPPAEVDSLFEILSEIKGQGVSILYVSHRLGEILALAERASVLRDGILQQTVELEGLNRADLVQLIVGDLDGTEAPAPSPTSAPESSPVQPDQPRSLPESSEGVFEISVSTRSLHNVKVRLNKGEIVGVAGLDGSGRDEICESMVGVLGGEIQLQDLVSGETHDRMTPAIARKLGVALVLPNRAPRSAVLQFSIAENVSLASTSEVSKRGLIKRSLEMNLAERWIKSLDIKPDVPTHLYAHLSGGNQQKTVFAKWLAISPRALLLEDPTTGVDVGARSRIYSLIKEQAESGLTVLVASSDVEDLVALCDRVVVMSHGHLVEEVVGDDISEARLLESLTRMGAENGHVKSGVGQ